MTYPIQGGFPNWTTPFTDGNGRLTRDGMNLLQLLFNRTGSATGEFIPSTPSSSSPIFFDSSSESDSDLSLVPGPPGPQGLQGASGATGPAAYLEAPEADEPMSIPGPMGPTGVTGAQGPIGPVLIADSPDADEPMMRGPLAPGGWYDEKGSGGTYGFASGVDFTGGTTTTLTLSQPYGSQANLIVAFDSAWQGADQFSLSGKTLAFTSAIPSGVQKVYVKGFLMPQ